MFQRASSRMCFNARNRIGRLRRELRRLRSCAGFTLTELIVIIVMAGILVATVGVKYTPIAASVNLRIAIDQVAGDLRFLQTRTMATMAYTTGTYTNTASFPMGANTYYLGGLVKNLPSGVTVQSGLTVTFNSLGEYSAITNGTLTLNSGGSLGSIQIYATSGAVVE